MSCARAGQGTGRNPRNADAGSALQSDSAAIPRPVKAARCRTGCEPWWTAGSSSFGSGARSHKPPGSPARRQTQSSMSGEGSAWQSLGEGPLHVEAG